MSKSATTTCDACFDSYPWTFVIRGTCRNCDDSEAVHGEF